MTTPFTITYKDAAPSPTKKAAYIVNGGDANRTTFTKTDANGFTIFYKDQVSDDVVTAPKNTVILDAGGAQSPTLPQIGIGRGNAASGCDTIQIRRDSLANWVTHNPILTIGEFGHVIGEQDLRIGDGVTPFLALSNLLTNRPYEAQLVGSCVTITETVHKQGTRPQIEVYAPDGDEVSVAVSNSAGTIEIASSNDLTGHTVVIRA